MGEAPSYTLEIFLKSNTDTEKIKEILTRNTTESAEILDHGTHVVIASKTTLELLEELCTNTDVEEIRGTHIPKGTTSLGPRFERHREDEY